MTITIYGIKTCDTMKKARDWLGAHGVVHTFHDYRERGIDRASLQRWIAEHGWAIVLNRASTSFRALPEADKLGLDDERAAARMLAQPTMIKRPVLDLGARRLIGFKPDLYAAAFAASTPS